jgi:Copper resistance protein D
VLLVATGVVRACFELRAISQLVTTGYGRAVLVKVVLLAALAGIGWINRRGLARTDRIRRNVAVELVLLACVVVAVGFLTQLRPGRDAPSTQNAAALVELARPPAPPPGAVVLAQQNNSFAVALAVQPGRYTVTVLAPSGGAARNLTVSVGGEDATDCGAGCYETLAPPRLPRSVRVLVGGHVAEFRLPRATRPADELVRRATRAFLHLRSVRYRERLSSGSTRALTTVWQQEAPNRVSYAIAHGAQAVVIGGRRWDRVAGGPWTRSDVTPLAEPSPIWGSDETNAHVVGGDASTVEITWASPSIPAFFDAVFDRRTMLPRTLRMTAAAHFMHHDYLEFNRPLRIRPPAR